MALRGIAQVSNVHYIDEESCQIECNYIGFGEDEVEQSFNTVVDQSDTAVAMGLAVVSAFKTRLTNVHGYTLDPLDTVRVFGIGAIEA